MSAQNAKMYTTTATATAAPTQTASATIKRENGIPKLSSLKPMRDLTLGGRGGSGSGSGAVKKEFKPNLNVVRNKNANVKTSKDTTGRGRGGRGRGERGGRGGGQRGGRGGANSSTLIQTSGVFSEGAGAVNIRKTAFGGSSAYSRNADDAPSAMRKPTIVKNELKKIDLRAEETQVRELLGDSDDDRNELMYDKTDLEQIPIKLHEAKWKKQIKQEIKVEAAIENGDQAAAADFNDEAALAMAKKLQALHVKAADQRVQSTMTTLRYPVDVDEFLAVPQPQLFVMQLPDVLPTCEDGDGADSDTPEKFAADKASTSAEATANPLNATPASSIRSNSKCLPLQQMEEGQVGKLVRYKSGKIKLVLGETDFDIEMGMETGFVQDLMSITTIREERQGNMINLGPIQAKLTATPDWETLLKKQEQQFSQSANASIASAVTSVDKEHHA